MTKEQMKLRLKLMLRYITAGVIPYQDWYGLCQALKVVAENHNWQLQIDWSELEDVYPYCSGDWLYPIEMNNTHCPKYAFNTYPLYNGEYGRRRRLLAKCSLEHFDEVFTLTRAMS